MLNPCAQPDQDRLRLGEYLCHKRYLSATLRVVDLINAELVDPNVLCFALGYDVRQYSLQILGQGKRLAI